MREFVVKDWKTKGPLAVDKSSGKPRGEAGRCVAEEVTPEATAPLVAPREGFREHTVPAEPRPEETKVTPAGAAKSGRRKAGAKGKAASSKGANRRERAFVVGYGGQFIGVFEAESEMTPCEAYARVAQVLAADEPEFRPELLQLYRPVLLKSARPSKTYKIVPGKLETFKP